MRQPLIPFEGVVVSEAKIFCAGWAALLIEGEPENHAHFGNTFELRLPTGQLLKVTADDSAFELQTRSGSWEELEGSLPEELRAITPGPHTLVRHRSATVRAGDRLALFGVVSDVTFEEAASFRGAPQKVPSAIQAHHIFTGVDAVQKRQLHLKKQGEQEAKLTRQQQRRERLHKALTFAAGHYIELIGLLALLCAALAYLGAESMPSNNARNLWGWSGGFLCVAAFFWYRRAPLCSFYDDRAKSRLSTYGGSLLGLDIGGLIKGIAFISFPMPISFIALLQEPKMYISPEFRSDPTLFAMGLQSGYWALYLLLLMIFLYEHHWRDAHTAWLMLKAKRERRDGQWQGVEGEITSTENAPDGLKLALKTREGDVLHVASKDASYSLEDATIGAWMFAVGRPKGGRLEASGPQSLFLFAAATKPQQRLRLRLLRFGAAFSLLVFVWLFLLSSLVYSLSS